MGLFWSSTYKSKSPDNKIVFRTELDVKNFMHNWSLRQSLTSQEERDFLENLLLKYLHDNDYGLQVKEIRLQVLPELRKHSYGNPYTKADFRKLKKMLLEL